MKRESRIVYICQLLGIFIGISLLTGFNHWKVGYWQILFGVLAGWFIGALIYVFFASKETDTD
ncbi:MAG: hypothetical protein ACHQJX_10505 [Candidatus Acidiferrales bacterium]